MYNVVYNDEHYTVVHTEDEDLSGSWEVIPEPIQEDDEFDDDLMYIHTPDVPDEVASSIIEFVIENM
jgi:hypothetical protein